MGYHGCGIKINPVVRRGDTGGKTGREIFPETLLSFLARVGKC
jgi:hypothetical protein